MHLHQQWKLQIALVLTGGNVFTHMNEITISNMLEYLGTLLNGNDYTKSYVTHELICGIHNFPKNAQFARNSKA